MAYFTMKMIGVKCDHCQQMFIDRFYGNTVYPDKETADASAIEEGWAMIGKKMYCPDCYHYDAAKQKNVVNDKKQ